VKLNWTPLRGRHEARRALSTDGWFGRLRRTGRPAVGNAVPPFSTTLLALGLLPQRARSVSMTLLQVAELI
jgi:hypothetical protein